MTIIQIISIVVFYLIGLVSAFQWVMKKTSVEPFTPAITTRDMILCALLVVLFILSFFSFVF